MIDEKVPFLDLVTMHRGLQDEFVDVLKTALGTAGFIGGPMVRDSNRTSPSFANRKSVLGSAAARMPCGLR